MRPSPERARCDIPGQVRQRRTPPWGLPPDKNLEPCRGALGIKRAPAGLMKNPSPAPQGFALGYHSAALQASMRLRQCTCHPRGGWPKTVRHFSHDGCYGASSERCRCAVCHWHPASVKCRMSLPAVWLASSLELGTASWLVVAEAMYQLLTGDTPVALSRRHFGG